MNKIIFLLTVLVFPIHGNAEEYNDEEFAKLETPSVNCNKFDTRYRYNLKTYPLPGNSKQIEIFNNFLNRVGLKGWHLDDAFLSNKKEKGKIFRTFVFSQAILVCKNDT